MGVSFAARDARLFRTKLEMDIFECGNLPRVADPFPPPETFPVHREERANVGCDLDIFPITTKAVKNQTPSKAEMEKLQWIGALGG